MGKRTKTPAEIFSYLTIALSVSCLSGLAMGHATERSMQARLSVSPPSDPVERYALGQNAYKTSNAAIQITRSAPPVYTDASYEIGRYKNGARILTPAEPARKIDRLRLERLQAWNDENFGDDSGLYDDGFDDEGTDYAAAEIDEYAPIDVGAVIDAPEATTRPVLIQIATSSSDH